jgi:endoglucanase
MPPPAARAARLALACCILLALLAGGGPGPPARAAGPTIGGVRVVENRLVDASGQTIRLLGVNRAGTEYACVQGWGIFDGPTDAASVAAIRAWGANAVRVPLNEGCWLGLDTVPEEFRGPIYRAAIREWVATLRAAGLYVILDLHWVAPAGKRADRLRPMPDRDHAPAFWQQVAAEYGGDGAILFDLFNEPYPDHNRDTEEAWRCWRDGGTCVGVEYQAAGMQELVDAVRGTGATNVILLGGVQYANAFSRFRTYAPRDPANNLAASWHSYNFMRWANEVSWDAQVAIPTAGVPLIAAEIGQDDCGTAFLARTLDWLDARGASYLGWAWNTWGRCDGPVLIDNYDGTPSAMGRALFDHLARLGPAPLAPPLEATVAAAPGMPEPVSAATPPPGAIVLYDDLIPAPFSDGSFGLNGKDPCDRATRASGRCAYALALSSWGGLGIGRDAGFSTTGYDRLEWSFNTHGQSLAGFAIALTAGDGGEVRPFRLDAATILADLGGGWVRLAVPLTELNPEGIAVRGVLLRNAAGRDLRTIHLDDLWLVPAEIGGALPVGAEAAAPVP